jgi:hypothetical protein
VRDSIAAQYERAVLTPNANEFRGLLKAVQLPENASCESLAQKFLCAVCLCLSVFFFFFLTLRRLGVTVVQKGQKDVISNEKSSTLSFSLLFSLFFLFPPYFFFRLLFCGLLLLLEYFHPIFNLLFVVWRCVCN